LRHRQFRLTAEYIEGQTQAKWPRVGTSSATAVAPDLIKDQYVTNGYSLQLEFPFPRFFLSDQTNFIFRAESMRRRGPQLNFFGEVLPGQKSKNHIGKYSA